uniref:Uncharacterized protein n=1 Tax=Steinernema glaseri TaxID=37863 RepID=A0A1I8AHC2_9BILA
MDDSFVYSHPDWGTRSIRTSAPSCSCVRAADVLWCSGVTVALDTFGPKRLLHLIFIVVLIIERTSWKVKKNENTKHCDRMATHHLLERV